MGQRLGSNWQEMHKNHINPLRPNISIQILHTLLYTFPLVLTRRICLTIKASQLVIIFFILMILNE